MFGRHREAVVAIALTLRKRGISWRRLTPANGLYLLAIHGLFAALIVMTILYTRQPTVVAISLDLSGAGPASGNGALTIGLAADDPVTRFSATRVGHILHAQRMGDHCRRVLFDNRSGELLESGSVTCGPVLTEASPVSGADRLQSLRKTFQR